MCFSRYRRELFNLRKSRCCFLAFKDLDDRDRGGPHQKRQRIGHGSSRLTRIVPADDDAIGLQGFDAIRHHQKWSPCPQQRLGDIWSPIEIVRPAAWGYDDQVGASGFPNKPCRRRFHALPPLGRLTSLFRNAPKPGLPGGEEQLHLFDFRLTADIDHDPVCDKGRPDAECAEAGDCRPVPGGYIGSHVDKIGLFPIGFYVNEQGFERHGRT